jgi:Ca2+-binding RTX toxin-like protein
MTTINGTSDSELLQGSLDGDVILALAGNDSLLGNEGEDRLFGDAGSDVIAGGSGNDTLVGATGTLIRNDGDEGDLLQGNAGEDLLFGNRGNDTLEGGQGSDTLFGGKQTDILNGGDGDDVIHGDLAFAQSVTDFGRTDYAANDAPIGIEAVDIDGDGDLDLVVANPGRNPGLIGTGTGNTLSILRNNGDGTFAAPVTVTTGVGPSLTTGDFDQDGDFDLVTVNLTDDTVSFLQNDGIGNFSAPVNFPAGDYAYIRNVADVDGDSDLDLIITNEKIDLTRFIVFDTTISVLRNNGNGTFATPEALMTGDGSQGVTSADLDGDEDLDVVVANKGDDTLSVLRNNGNGTFATPTQLAVGDNPNDVVAADLDGDGDVDLVNDNRSESNISVLYNNGDGTFGQPTYITTNQYPGLSTPTDLDGDGDLDLTLSHIGFTIGTGETSGTSISVLRNNGNGSFATPESFPVASAPTGLVIADLDGIRYLDIATPSFDNDGVTVYLNQAFVTEGDTLTGGAGADDFVFSRPGTEGDTITDFQPGVDQIQLAATGFDLTPGAIPAEQFALGSVALDSDDRFLYNIGTGILTFDPDGTGAETPFAIAALTGAPSISVADIVAV